MSELANGIAVIGLSCRFPGAADVDQLWRNLVAGVESITRFSERELDEAGIPPEVYRTDGYVKAAPILGDVSGFDAGLFEISPREAALMDPQQRFFLECSWEALEAAGHDPARGGARVGVFAGSFFNTYAISQIYGNPELLATADPLQVMIGADKDYLATLVSYKLNLTGPSMGVQTACSTSLVAVHLACQHLLTYQCDLAVAGGATVVVPQVQGYRHMPGGIVSQDGHCRAFDASASGTVFGSGVGVVVLKRLEDALADGDTVDAVILSTAVNNDGALKVGFTAPGVRGQADVIASAQALAGVPPETIGYVETHGTGTALGDPIEITALERAFREGTDRCGFCAIGSIKSNFGHLNVTAGVAGLIKAVLALRHRAIPPSLHFERPNAEIDLDRSPFYVATRLEQWHANGAPRRAGVSSFGIGGTNAHAVLEEAPEPAPTDPGRPWQVLTLSARTPSALERATERLADHLAEHPDLDLADVAFTLQMGRRQLPRRRAVVCRDVEDAVAALRGEHPRRRLDRVSEGSARPVAFVFPGQGAQHVGMLSGLYRDEPAFRQELDRCLELLRLRMDLDLGDLLFASDRPDAAARLARTEVAQPALVAVEYALARLWASWGVEPQAMMGHSVGEYVAACLAGVFGLDEVLGLVVARGRLMQELTPGAMLSVPLGEREVEPLLAAGLSIAAVNAPGLTVVAGPFEGVERLEAELAARSVAARRLDTSHAFHSEMIEPMLERFRREVERTDPRPPRIPFVSNLTGTWIRAEEATDPRYWTAHCRRAVRFSDGLERLAVEPDRLLLEVGPGRTLSALARRHPRWRVGRIVVPSLPRAGAATDERAALMEALGHLWSAGAAVDWAGHHRGERRRRLRLPTYPFEHRRCWVERAPAPSLLVGAAPAPPVEGEAPALLDSCDASRPALATPYVEPRDETEARIAELWREALGFERIGVEDDFLELGGHSLLATRLVGRLREALWVDLPLNSLFECPTVAALAQRVGEMRLRGEGLIAPGGELPVLEPAPESRFESFPLTDIQQAYWVGRSASFELGNVASHVYWEVESTELDVAAIEVAWRRLVDRHDMLRAVILPGGRQWVLETVPPYRIATVDLTRVGEAAETRALQAVRAEMSHQVLATDQWPIFDVRASRLSGGRLRLHLSFDFLLCDAVSFQILGRELALVLRDPGAEMPPLGVSFRDVVLAQAAFRDSERYRRSLKYWRARAATLPPGPELPLARKPALVRSPRFTRHQAELPAETWRELKRRAVRAGLSHSAVLVAAYAEVLATWSKTPRFTINLTVLPRPPIHPQIGAVVGDFTSLTLLEADHTAADTFLGRALRLRDRLLLDLDHRHVSGVEVMRELARIRDAEGGRVAMPVVFTSLLNTEEELPAAPQDALPARVVYSVSQAPQVWIDHQVMEDPDGRLVYNWDAVEELFPAGLLDDMFGAYDRLLRDLAAGDEAWSRRAAVLPPPEHLEVRSRANRTAVARPLDGLLWEGAYRQAELRPEAAAVIAPGRTLSYRELTALADGWAGRLRAAGVRRGGLVAVVMEKGWEQVVAVLAIQRAGAAYLPIDPDLPEARIRHLLAAGKVEIALTHPRRAAAPALPDGVLVLEVSADAAETEVGSLAGVDPRPEDLAYVIFTSGSTGLPKGVTIDHRGALNTVDDVNRRFEVGPGDRVLALSALSFDLSVYDVFGVLGAGGAVVFPEPSALREPARWLELMAEHQVTLWNSVPALAEMLVDHLESSRGEPVLGLRTVLLSGDWIPLSLPARIRRSLPEARVVSLGGATEGSIWSILYPIEEVAEGWSSVPYGLPMENQTFHVLDHQLEPRPLWVPGHLYIGGRGVALGYWGEGRRTAESFVPDPRGGERLYRTGDLGRLLPDGTIEFLGREDSQVKIQGYRIELGEVEAALTRHPAVRDGVVAAVGEARGVKRLVGYVVLEPAAAERAGAGDHLSSEQVEHWQALFDQTYGDAAEPEDPTLNIAGWTSSLTGEGFSRAEMERWADATVERILARRPERVLEIGCGTGMLLFRIAPRCRLYRATDVSARALDYVRSQMGGDPAWEHVGLVQAPADRLPVDGDERFDAVVINSVVQYFPSSDYLEDVLRAAVAAVAPGGIVFVGDVRDRLTVEALYAATEVRGASGDLARAHLVERVARRRDEEEELVLEPGFFAAAAARIPGVAAVEVLPKRGRGDDELLRFRYDALLHVGEPAERAEAVPELDWQEQALSPAVLGSLLAGEGPRRLRVRGIPNARVAREVALVDALGSEDAAATVGGLLVACEVGDAVDPEDLHLLAAEAGYRAAVGVSAQGRPGLLHALFERADDGDAAPILAALPEPLDGRPPGAFANNPLQRRLTRRLAPEVEAHLRLHLPSYMVPSTLVLLDRLPLTANGKVDRGALPVPGAAHREAMGAETSPRTPLEWTVAQLWREILGVESLGVHDSFFGLGGHSLLATRLVARLRQDLDVELPLRELFEHPTVAALAERIEALRGGAGGEAPIPRAPRDGRIPLSFSQRRLWFFDQLVPGSPVYNMPASIRLRGQVEVPALAWALSAVVRRHESLRTRFAAVAGEPYQLVDPPGPARLPWVDLAALPRPVREAEVRRRAASEARLPFDLGRGPLLRATHLRVTGEEWVLLVTAHHIVADGWSMGVFYRELDLLYQARVAGTPPPLPDLALQYADFAYWQNRQLTGVRRDELIEHWRGRLEGLPTLQLPTDRPRPRFETFRGGVVSTVFESALVERLRALGEPVGATPFMTFLAGFKTLLLRYSGQTDVVAGSVVAARPRPELEGMIGFLMNMLVLRTDLSGDPSFAGALGQVRASTLDAFAHQDLPFELLVEELEPERDPGRNPLCQVLLLYQNFPRDLTSDGSRVLELMDSGTSKFDLMLFLDEVSSGLQAKLEYNEDLFDGTTARRMLGHLRTLLDAASRAPETSLEALPLLSAPERQHLVREWNDTERPLAPGRIEALIESRAERAPDAVAVCSATASMSYGELDRRAARVASLLAALGIGSGDMVGIYLQRSIEMLPALLGVLRCGAAYVPIEPEYPPARVEWILRRMRIGCVLTEQALADGVAGGGDLPDLASVVCLDGDGRSAEGGPRRYGRHDLEAATGRPRALGGAGDVAYTIFTSGSTGTPKGVVVTHEAVVNLIDWVNRAFEVGPGDRLLFVTSLCFDLSVYDVFGSLAAGASVRVASEEELGEPRRLFEIVRDERVTFWDSAPAALQQLVPFFPAEPFDAALRLVFLSGDWIPVRLPDRVRSTFPRSRVVSLGGATEATVWSNVYPVGDVGLRWVSIPYGRPIQNARYLALDGRFEPAPVGVPADLLIAGECLSLGYESPRTTAASFLPDPFGARPGGRLYRTGDRVRFLASGDLEFLGRADLQVKIRGFRIELGEIEGVLGADPEVAACVASVHEHAGERRLVAYAVPRARAGEDGDDRLVAALLRRLERHLPPYMVPASLVLLAELPLTPSGKVDRRRLPAPTDGPRGGEAREVVAPRDPVEEVLAAAWEEVLGVDAVGVTESFFDLGGHSLLATQVTARVAHAFGVQLPLRELFEHPTVAGLARAVRAARQGAVGLSAPIERGTDEGEPPLSFAQRRLWLLDQVEGAGPTYNIPAAMRLRGRLDLAALAGALAGIVRRHEVLRTTYVLRGTEPRQRIADPSPPSLPVVDLTGLSAGRARALAAGLRRRDAARAFDLARGPVLRVTLARLGTQDHLVLVNLHHIAGDGWSAGVLVGEIGALYDAAVAGCSAALRTLDVQYADYAVWQRKRLAEPGVLEPLVAYWRERLGEAPVIELPFDRTRAPQRSYRGSTVSASFGDRIGAPLHGLARRGSATFFMVLLAGFEALLSRLSGQRDFTVGTPVAGRDRLEVEGLIGFFVNNLVLRADLSGDPSLEELLARVREDALGAYAHQDLPFESLIEALAPARDLSHPPLFQVMLVLQNAPLPPLRLSGLTVEPVTSHPAGAKFELTLLVTEHAGGMLAELEYDAGLFDASTARRLLGQLETLLEAAGARPEARVCELPLLSPRERHQVTVEWGAGTPAGPARSLPELFAEQVLRRPDGVAIVAGGDHLSYGEVHRRASRLASELREAGVRAENAVGLLCERSPATLVGLLGILEAGAAYVPLEPEHPEERLRFVLEDAGVRVLVGQEPALGRVEAPDLVRRIAAPGRCGGSEPPAPAARRPDPAQTAYLIYTSGSTGRPKGVAVTHANVARLLATTTAGGGGFDFGPDDAWTLFHSFAFDFSVWEIWGALAFGGRLVVVPYWVSRTPAEMDRLLHRERVTVLNQTPSAFLELVRVHGEGGVPVRFPVRSVVFGGEALDPSTLAAWVAGRPGAPALVNMYGITETTVHVTFQRLGAAELASGKSRIGRALPDLEARVLDPASLRPVAIGAQGEIHVGGAGLARGYHGRPGLTAERFIPHPWASAPGERLYRSGDLGRLRSDGGLEYAGRLDHQVKVRGFRIELGEIESALASHPDVATAVCRVLETEASRRLVAYAVPSAGAAPDRDELRRFLGERLPPHMVPALFVLLDRLPLTANGKIDRAALPEPTSSPDTGVHEEPGGEAERVLVAVWKEALQVERVGPDDDFFALGGDSILGILIARRAKERGLDVTPRHLFLHPTVRELASALAEQGVPAASEVPDSPVGDVPLTPIQRRFFSQELAEPHHFNQWLLVRLEEADRRALALALGALWRHHDALRTTFRNTDRGWGGTVPPVAAAGPVAPVYRVDLSRLSRARREPVVHAVARAAQGGFALDRGPLFRAVVVEGEPSGSAWLLLVAHHLVIDAVSWRVLLADLDQAYRSVCAGQDEVLAPRTTSFRGWARASEQRARRLIEAGDAGELAYWAALPSHLPGLPVDRPGGSTSAGSAGTVAVSLDAETTRRLLRESHRAYNTRAEELMLTALAVALTRWSGGPRVLVALEDHGREEADAAVDLSRTVGWFTALFPLLLDLSAGRDEADAIRAVKEQRRAVPGRGLGYGLLRHPPEGPGAERLAALPDPRVAFNYLGRTDLQQGSEAALVARVEGSGLSRSPRQAREHLIDVDAWVSDGRLQATWTFSRELHDEETVARLGADFVETLGRLIEHCLEPGRRAYTPSDFPLAGLSQAELDSVVEGRGEVEDVYPLSPLQEGFLFHLLKEPESGTYVHQLACTLEGPLDPAAFGRAWRRVVDRHPVLRSTFAWKGLDRPLQLVHPEVAVEIERLDWEGLPMESWKLGLDRLLEQDRRHGYALDRAPLMRLYLVRLAAERHALVWSHHHLILDGWSVPILLQDFFAWFRDRAEGDEPSLPPSPPYRDYVAWLEGRDDPGTEAFWRRELAGFTAPTALGGVTGAGEAREIEEVVIPPPPAVARAARAMARRRQLTLNTLLQGAWGLILGHLAGRDDVLFGTTVSVRPPEIPRVEAMVGVLLNTVPVRVRIERDRRLSAWLEALQDRQAEMRQHQHAPLVSIRRWSEVEPRQPFFETVLTIQNYPVDESLRRHSGELGVREVRFLEKATFALSLALLPGEEMPLQLRYDPNRFDAEAAGRLLAAVCTLLEAFAATPEAPVEHFLGRLAQADLEGRGAEAEEYRRARTGKFQGARRRSIEVEG